ncbi:MAG: hypothetical protein ACE369_14515 [Roseovarius sp.]
MMYGAVLWSDQCTNRALIWCSDHGDLAFFDGRTDSPGVPPEFEAGDLVTFNVRDGRGMRQAFDVNVVSSEEYPCLAQDLRGMATDRTTAPRTTAQAHAQKIVPFKPAGTHRNRSDRPAKEQNASVRKLR